MRMPALSLAILFLLVGIGLAEDSQSTYCTFDDGNQVSVQYSPSVKDPPRNGRVWSPGITLFVQTPLALGGREIPLGAYSVHLIPERKNWTIIVNKGVGASAAYNSAEDLARAPMEIGEIPEAVKSLQLTFAHMAAKQCSLQVYYQKTGAFAEFLEK
ncbi:MAG: DUF2911 domain-containing protein [Acidobacteria bacterium]|nr:DUF2911 domain-containing protein [Acidobacteriota bacterium]